MFLERKLKRWVDAGLISDSVKTEILIFENQDSKSSVPFAILGIGALSIIVGIISVIAANWYNIPKDIKLISNFIWLISLAIGVFVTDKFNTRIFKEVLILLLFGSIIGTIALIGQIYHLESHPFKTFSFWLAIGTPVVTYSRTKYTAHVWAIVLSIWAFMGHGFFFPENFYIGTNALNLGYVSLVLIYIAIAFRLIGSEYQIFSDATFKYASLSFCFIVMFVGSTRWRFALNVVNYQHSLMIILLSFPIIWYLKKTYSSLAALIFITAIGFSELPNLFVHEDLKVLGALYFITCWTMLAYYGIKSNNKKLFEMSSIVISIRIIFIYFEVFGSLLQTGVGLISSGVFILLVAYVWYSRREKLWGMRQS